MRRLPILLALGAACVLLGAPSAATAPRTTTGSQCMVIWSVYRSGGSYSGGPVATYDRQYLNLLNRCSTTVNLTTVLFDWWAQGRPIQAAESPPVPRAVLPIHTRACCRADTTG